MFSLFHAKPQSASAVLFDMLRYDEGKIDYDKAIAWLEQAPALSIDLSFTKTIFNDAHALLEVLFLTNHSSYNVIDKHVKLLKLLLEKDNVLLNYKQKINIFEQVIHRLCIASYEDHEPYAHAVKDLLIEDYMKRAPVARLPEPIETYEKEEILEQLAGFPNEERWRLLIDAKLQKEERAWFDYELREPGSMLAMRHTFDVMLNSLDQPLSVELLKHFYVCCTCSVNNLNDAYQASFMRPSLYNASGFGVAFEHDNLSVRGLVELEERAANAYDFNGYRVSGHTMTDQILDDKIKEYQARAKTADTPLRQLRLIVQYISELERMHPFPDANCRTLCIILLNRELLQHNFSPVILENPNRFDGFSIHEMMLEVLEGMHRFQEVRLGRTGHLGLTHQEIEDELQHPSHARLLDVHHQLIAAPRMLESIAGQKRGSNSL